MFTTIAINEETNNILIEVMNKYKEKYDLKKAPARGKIIELALQTLKAKEGL